MKITENKPRVSICLQIFPVHVALLHFSCEITAIGKKNDATFRLQSRHFLAKVISLYDKILSNYYRNYVKKKKKKGDTEWFSLQPAQNKAKL